MQMTITAEGFTIQTITSTLRNSSMGDTITVKVWQDRRVYVNTKSGMALGYIEINGNTLTLANMTKASGKLSEIAAILADGPGVDAVATPAASQASKAQAFDNLHNEGYRNGGYNPYRSNETYSSYRELARHMAAEGGDHC